MAKVNGTNAPVATRTADTSTGEKVLSGHVGTDVVLYCSPQIASKRCVVSLMRPISTRPISRSRSMPVEVPGLRPRESTIACSTAV